MTTATPDWAAIGDLLAGNSEVTGQQLYAALDGIKWALSQTIPDSVEPIPPPSSPSMSRLTFNQVLRSQAADVCNKMLSGSKVADIEGSAGQIKNWRRWADVVLTSLTSINL